MLVVSELAGLAAGNRRQINLRRVLVRGFVNVGDRERNPIAFGRNLWIANASNFQEIVDGKTPLLRECERQQHKQSDRDGKQTLHKITSQLRLSFLGKADALSHFWTRVATSSFRTQA